MKLSTNIITLLVILLFNVACDKVKVVNIDDIYVDHDSQLVYSDLSQKILSSA